MDVFEAITERQSIRSFRPEPVSDDAIGIILQAGRLAPSSLNKQRRCFIVVKDKLKKAKLVDACQGQKFVAEAPTVIVVCSDDDTETKIANGVNSWVVDTAISVSFMMLAAVEQGLGSCWVGNLREESVREVLGIPQNIKICCLLPVGVPASRSKRTSRKPLESLVSYERWV